MQDSQTLHARPEVPTKQIPAAACFAFFLFVILVVTFFAPTSTRAEAGETDTETLAEKIRFAEYLMEDRDYFRAITVFKEVVFLSDVPETRHTYMYEIAKAYEKSNRHRASIKYLSRLFNEPDVAPSLLNRGRIRLGLDYYGMRVLSQSRHVFDEASSDDPSGFALTYLGLLEAERGDWTASSTLFGQAADLAQQPALKQLTRELEEEILSGELVSSRSPALAALMSAIIPGSGQFYCGHNYDGLQAFLYVGAFSLATYATYRYDRDLNDNYVATGAAVSVTALFHAANIVGAYRTAGYYNLRRQEVFMDGVRVKVFSVDF